jgi:hypothetical protein
MRNKEFEFTLILSGVSEITDAMENAVFVAGCNDALLGSRDGVVFLKFGRKASSFDEAVTSAIRAVRLAGYKIARVEPDDYVSMAEIARRSGWTREYIRKLASGQRGSGGFPAPIANATRRSPIYRWMDVEEWLTKARENVNRPLVSKQGAANKDGGFYSGKFVALINATLNIESLGTIEEVNAIRKKLEPQPSTKMNRRYTKAK